MAKTYTMRLAGQEWQLRFRSKDRAAIEKAAGRGLVECVTSGMVEDHALIVWGGLRHLNLEPEVSVERILDLIDEHNDRGGDFYSEVMRPVVMRCLMESKVYGAFKPHEVDKLCGDVPEAKAAVPQ